MNIWVLHKMYILRSLGPDFLKDAPTLEATLLIPAKNSAHALEGTVQEAHRFMSSAFPRSFEIVLIPNPTRSEKNDHSVEVAESLARRYPEVLVRSHCERPGKGAALRTGMTGARGKWIFFTDADLPYDLTFFEDATVKLR